MSNIERILVANRGEIAVRIIKSIQKLGKQAISIYSDIDRNSPHVILADEAYPLHGIRPLDSYLSISKIIEISKKAHIDAIHPGYGFLSENAQFARAIREAGLIFIGPSPDSIAIMGDKISAKEAVAKYDVPLVPGLDHAIEDIDQALSAAKAIGFPVLIKASAGGGGKGMRIVFDQSEFQESFHRAVSEAKSAFGDGRVFIEKYIEDPKHIEVQIIADQHGNTLYLFERECSIQRRHQKVIEEAPSPSVDQLLRKQLGETAIKVAQSCSYVGAGTVEFIMDRERRFYFLEMNTRLQVEHPVTECITGLDLVEMQIHIAENQPLNLVQSDLHLNGHAIELRVYAEDTQNNFLPSPGKLSVYQKPDLLGVRVDDGVLEGNEISVYYDPMISKLIAYGSTREASIKILLQAISNYQIEGVETTLEFGTFVLSHPNFIGGDYTTQFVEAFYTPKKNAPTLNQEVASLLGAYFYRKKWKELRLPSH